MIFNPGRLLTRTIISHSHPGEQVKAGTALFHISHERLDNINLGAL